MQDRISRAMGAAARAAGFAHDAFRTDATEVPLAPDNRFLRLHALFNARDPRFGAASAYGKPAWYGVFDTAYTRPGDYLVGPGGTFFIAAQEHLLPALCILTNAVVSVTRAGGGGGPGVQAYGGGQFAGATVPVLSGWPASVLAAGGGGRAVLPADGRPGSWAILLPPGPFAVRTSDTVRDESGRAFVVDTAERSSLGTRIGATQTVV